MFWWFCVIFKWNFLTEDDIIAGFNTITLEQEFNADFKNVTSELTPEKKQKKNRNLF